MVIGIDIYHEKKKKKLLSYISRDHVIKLLLTIIKAFETKNSLYNTVQILFLKTQFHRKKFAFNILKINLYLNCVILIYFNL